METSIIHKIKASKSRSIVLSSNNVSKKLLRILENNLKKNFKLNEKGLNSISRKDLLKLNQIVSVKCKKQIVDTIYPLIKSLVPNSYLELKKKNLRPSLQCKYKWGHNDENYLRKTFYTNNIMYESRFKENFCFPTRPHQDFENNGFRSLNTLIFYFQLTKVTKKSCDLKVANFKKTPSLLEYKNIWNYQNQFSEKCNKNLNWRTPNNLDINNMFVMDALTPHSSDLKSSIPRLAINVKLHPTKNDFLYDKDFLIFFKKNYFSNQKKIVILLKYLQDNLSNCPEFNLELATLEYLFGKKKKALDAIKNFCSFKINEKEITKIIIGMFLRKNLFQINKKDIFNFKNDKLKINDLSFAERAIGFLKNSY